ncbi:Ubiquitinyl hydrolase 1 [Handroanthus impetiginosus]|uniref:Ubiquitinyl hydrolase 1 n=1 Tax=Handroanthus impetiginosus TaxID=429701 RepID=A0A2G9HLD3_9LAMI|nr:Ubiquitinyl hydrolase 1 [Handroanthus impetiginosus]
MANEESKKRNFIEISSSDESESSPSESDEDAVAESSSSSSCYDDDDDDYVCDDDDDDDNEEDDDDDDGDDESEWSDLGDEEEDEGLVDEDGESIDAHVDKDDEESMWKKVIRSIRGGSDIQELKLVECKAYLRRHGLRLSGTKEECIERIKEHWRLKDGNVEAFYPRSSFIIDCTGDVCRGDVVFEAFYPRSSFIIDCTGDVCRGDVVLFNQKVYQTWNRFDKRTRGGSLLGRRTVAGRVVKESYGAARQQHTFTVIPIFIKRRLIWSQKINYVDPLFFQFLTLSQVEVLWSRGTKKLDPLFPLLVKGRNLYKLKTFRQNEKERLEILAEKHRRGAAARSKRALRKEKAALKANKSSMYKGAKRCKHFHHVGPSGTQETTHMKKNRPNEYGNTLAKNKKWTPSKSSTPFQKLNSKQSGGLRGPASRKRHQNLMHFPYNYPSQTFNHFQSDVFPRELHHFHSSRGSAFTTRLPCSYPVPKPISEWKEVTHGSFIGPGYSHSKNVREPRKFSRFSR